MELKRFGKVGTKDVQSEDLEKTYVLTAIAYTNMVYKVSGKTVYFLTGDKNSLKYKTKIRQIKELLKICTELEIDVEKYIQIQFNILLPWIKKTKKLSYLPFNMLVSKNAKERFEEWERKHNKKYESTKEKEEAFKANSIKYRDSIFKSAEVFYKILKKTNSEEPLKVLQMLARLGSVTKLYVYSHPEVVTSDLLYLGKIKKQVEQILTKDEKDIIRQLRKEVTEKYGEEYV